MVDVHLIRAAPHLGNRRTRKIARHRFAPLRDLLECQSESHQVLVIGHSQQELGILHHLPHHLGILVHQVLVRVHPGLVHPGRIHAGRCVIRGKGRYCGDCQCE